MLFSVKGYIRKGHANLAMHEPSRALQAFEKALDIDPNNPVSFLWGEGECKKFFVWFFAELAIFMQSSDELDMWIYQKIRLFDEKLRVFYTKLMKLMETRKIFLTN